MGHLTNYEKETILRTSEADKTWNIYTCNKSLQNKLLKFSEEYPDKCRLTETGEYGDMTFEILKKSLSVRPIKPLSDEQREALRERARKYGFKKKST